MPKKDDKTIFKILINGENILINLSNKVAKHGFYITRTVEAKTEDEAKAKAIKSLKDEIAPLLLNKNGDMPQFKIEGIETIDILNEHPLGFSWYEEKKGIVEILSSLIRPKGKIF